MAILYGKVVADLGLTRGVHIYEELLKEVMTGAQVTMMASELLKDELGRIQTILDDVVEWMEEHEYEPLAHLRGSRSQRNVADPAAFERAN